MKYFGVGCLIVLREKEPVGIITLGDIKRWADISSDDLHLTPVKEIMSEPLIWVSNDTQLQEAHEVMIRNKIKKLPVIGYLSRGPTLLGILERVEIEFEYPELVHSFY
jgi:CBS domain-containing protein